jgi:hypothetical protein
MTKRCSIFLLTAVLSFFAIVVCHSQDNASSTDTSSTTGDTQASETDVTSPVKEEPQPVVNLQALQAEFPHAFYPLTLGGLKVFLMDIQYTEPEVFLRLYPEYKTLEDRNTSINTLSIISITGGGITAGIASGMYMGRVVMDALLSLLSICTRSGYSHT